MTERNDAYANLMTGLGSTKDKSSAAGIYRAGDLGQAELDVMYEQDSLAARIVDRIVDDGTRGGFDIVTDESVDIVSVKSELEDLEALTECGDAWRWSRLYGGTLLFLNANDGGKMSEPLDLESVTKLSSLQVIESPYVTPADYNPGLGARAFRNPERYNILVPFGSERLRLIHRSRVVRFDGVRVPPTRLISRGGWGPSVLDRVVRELVQLGEAMGYSRNIMHEISIMVLRLEGFREQVCGTPDQQEQIKKVVEAIRLAIDNLHTLAIDKQDEYAERTRTVSGISDLVNQFIAALSRSTDYPEMILLNKRADGSGLANSAGSELDQYYGNVDAQRGKKITPALNKILEVMFAARRNRGESVPSEWTIKYPPLIQPSEKERSETDLRNAQRDQIYMTFEVTSPEEVRARLIAEGRLVPINGTGVTRPIPKAA